mgnify:FL=1
MKDVKSIFKHSGAGTGFYGGPDRSGDYFQKADNHLAGKYFQGD